MLSDAKIAEFEEAITAVEECFSARIENLLRDAKIQSETKTPEAEVSENATDQATAGTSEYLESLLS